MVFELSTFVRRKDMKKVVIGLSGGVDSSVAAYLLLQKGYQVIGVYMRNWHDETVVKNNECPWIDDSNDALLVAEHLGIPFHVVDFSEQYKKKIVDYMFREYEKGRTPNPDILCNREIKFAEFAQLAKRLGADFVATGHYCRKDTLKSGNQEIYRLLAGKDSTKDQSYFLCQVTQQQLGIALFPVGDLPKKEVRKIAAEIGLPTAHKKDSQGLCFVGKIRLPDFLQQQLKPKVGNVVLIPQDSSIFDNNDITQKGAAFKYEPSSGIEIGKHNGAHFYTIGQRKGLKIGGYSEPLFVLATDTLQNIVYVGMGEEHRGLYRKELRIQPEDIHWVRADLKMKIGEKRKYKARIRYRQSLSDCTLYMESDALYVVFEQPQRGITPGQFAAWYYDDELIGSGVIVA
jgi:tRNA-specific 2-thiouridylase